MTPAVRNTDDNGWLVLALAHTLLTFQDEFEMLLPQRHLLLRPACFPVLILLHSSPLLLLLIWGGGSGSLCAVTGMWWYSGLRGLPSDHLLCTANTFIHGAIPRALHSSTSTLGVCTCVLVPCPFPLSHAEVLRRKGCFCFAFTLCPTAQRGASYLVSTQKYL